MFVYNLKSDFNLTNFQSSAESLHEEFARKSYQNLMKFAKVRLRFGGRFNLTIFLTDAWISEKFRQIPKNRGNPSKFSKNFHCSNSSFGSLRSPLGSAFGV